MLASSAIDCDGGWTMFGARPGLVWYRSVAAAGPGGRRRGAPQQGRDSFRDARYRCYLDK